MVIRQHQPVPVCGGADQRHPEGRLVGQVTHRGAFGGAEPLDLLIADIGIGGLDIWVEIYIAPGRHRVGRDDLHRLVELVAVPGHQLRMAVDDGVHRIAQALRVEWAGHADFQLPGIEIVAGCCGGGVEEQPLLHRGQRQHVGDLLFPLQLIDLLLAQPGGREVGRRQSAATAPHVRADAGQCVEPQPAEPGDLLLVKRGGRPGPVDMQLRAGTGVDSAGVDIQGVHQRHGHRRSGTDQRQAVLADPPTISHRLGRIGPRGAQPTEIVEADRRVGPI